MTAVVRDSRPPRLLVRALSVFLRPLLRTPAARGIRNLVLLEFEGRRSGRRHQAVTGWYEVGSERVVFTPAAWRANFTTGAPMLVRHRGHRLRMWGSLVADPRETARAIDEVLASGQSTRFLAVQVAPGHRLTPADITSLGWAMIVLRPA